ncbi:cell division control protein 45 homolog [Toxorhynchites rutilus septentrionalis]|uniref:cell division control protein 45 homolog n=1 Tax=Toxorhynchites rutilus septentrionalis TaxID=329112 RepID=UPI002479B47B|nr:cell division control protein 45 homolog [Toxorhynchites rutilus septentrionalis]
MFVKDLKTEFYQLLIGKRILVIVNYDIDAICASKILQSLFKYDNMLYSIVPVMGISGMKRAFHENKEDLKYVLLVNCGGCIDILQCLGPEPDVIIFICDSHRPYDVCNIYNEVQVRILGEPDNPEGIPKYETIFVDSEDEDDDEDEDVDSSYEDNAAGTEKLDRVQCIEQRLVKRRQRREWEQNSKKIMFEYTQFSYYASSSALTIFELAWRLSKDSVDLLWWAIVGVTEQFLLGKIESSAYTLVTDIIQSHVSRLNNKATDQAIQTSVKINFENDLHLALYRHWSVLDSLKYSIYPACKLKLWTYKGEKVMHELLVDMGLPLVQAKQTFSAMELVLRKEFHDKMESFAEKYRLTDVSFVSFVLKYGYRNNYAAADYVYSMLAILESVQVDRTPETCFLQSMDALSRSNREILDGGIDICKKLLSAIFKQVQSSLEMHAVHSAGSFLYFIMQEEISFFTCPYGLIMLARFLLRGHVAISRNRRAQELPLVAVAPIDLSRGFSLLVGIPPVCEASKNFFGEAFEQAARHSGSTISKDCFETSVIQIRHSDCTKFLDALTVLLA